VERVIWVYGLYNDFSSFKRHWLVICCC